MPKTNFFKKLFLFLLVAAFLAGVVYFGPSLVREEKGDMRKPAAPGSLDPLATIRIATWDLTPLNLEKMHDPTRAERISRVLAQFDIAAIQGVTARNEAILIELVNQLKGRGRNASYAVSQGVGTIPEYLAFLFDQDRVMIDRSTLADVVDPLGRLSVKPLAAAFRTKEPPPDKAFTFVLINVKLDPGKAEQERELLPDIFRSFQDNPRNEDDILMLGNFELPLHEIGPLALLPEIVSVQRDMPTTIDHRWSPDNIFFPQRATAEYVERFGILDFATLFALTPEEAAAISKHMPLWADFSIFEGGQP